MIMGIRARYNLLKYMYTQMAIIHKEGGSYFQPLWMQFPDDADAANKVGGNQAMLGEALLLSIQASDVNMNQTEFYLPAGTWCNIYNLEEICKVSTGQMMNMTTYAYDFYVHLREGYGVTIQNSTTNALNITNTSGLDKNPLDLHFNPGQKDANGFWSTNATYYADDGLTLTSAKDYNHTMYKFHAYKNDSQNQYAFDIEVLSLDGDCITQNNLTEKFNQIYMHNAMAAGIVQQGVTEYTVIFTYADGSKSNFISGLASYDKKKDAVVFTIQKSYDFEFCHFANISLTPKII